MYETLYEKENSYLLSLKEGDILTSNSEIFDISGSILFNKHEKCVIDEIIKEPARYSSFYNIQYPEKVTGFKIKDKYGIWFLNTFKETIKYQS